jgi:hypothetical protein
MAPTKCNFIINFLTTNNTATSEHKPQKLKASEYFNALTSSSGQIV